MSMRIFQAIKPWTQSTTIGSLLLKNTANEINQKRNVIYYDRNTGRRHTEQDAVKRCYRLEWGGWIRTRKGRKNHLWKKPWFIKWYTRQHVFCHEEISADLEKMIAPDIKKRRYFLDDPYEPYHKRHGIEICPHDKLATSKSYVKMLEDY